MKLTRKTSLFLFVALCSGLGVWWWLTRPTAAPILTDQLSPRAEEFIATQRSDGTGLWNAVELTAPEAAHRATQSSISTRCFSLQLPLRTSNPKTEQTETRCSWRAKSIEPRGYVTVASYPSTDFAADSGITLRQRAPTIYTETPLVLPGFSAATVFRSDTEVMVFAAKNQTMLTLALTDLSRPSTLTDAQLTALITALQLTDELEAQSSPSP